MLALGGCTRTEAPADPAGLVPLSLSSGEATWTLLVPPDARLGPGAGTVLVAPDTRANPTLTLGAEAAGAEADLPRTATLASGATLAYRTDVVDAAGSGGAEATLHGRLTMPDGQSLAVGCATQGETQGDTPRPTWCVAYLHYLRPGAARDPEGAPRPAP